LSGNSVPIYLRHPRNPRLRLQKVCEVAICFDETLRWRGPTPAFAQWAEKINAPRLLDRVKGFASRGSQR
jgi:cytochrome P450